MPAHARMAGANDALGEDYVDEEEDEDTGGGEDGGCDLEWNVFWEGDGGDAKDAGADAGHAKCC